MLCYFVACVPYWIFASYMFTFFTYFGFSITNPFNIPVLYLEVLANMTAPTPFPCPLPWCMLKGSMPILVTPTLTNLTTGQWRVSFITLHMKYYDPYKNHQTPVVKFFAAITGLPFQTFAAFLSIITGHLDIIVDEAN